MSDTAVEEAPGLDVDAAVEQIGNDLFPNRITPEPEEPVAADPAPVADASTPAATPTETVPTGRAVPKSWPKDMHDYWGKTDPKVQEYWETREADMLKGLEQYKADASYARQLRDVITPYQSLLQQHRLEPHQAVATLLNAHARLTTGSIEQRQAAYEELGRNLGINLGQGSTTPATPVDPALQSLLQRQQQLEQTLYAQQQASLQEAHAKASKDVEAFASDPTHAYFDEVHDDIVKFIQQGASLQDAYERAVWANPATRAKELARVQTETEAKLKETARLEALPKAKAKSVNVRSRETLRTPTEPLGSMEDTLRSTLAELRGRTTH